MKEDKLGDLSTQFIIKVLIVLFLIALSPIILIWVTLATILDYFKYKKTRYYKDTCEKYTWLCANSYCISFYNAIKSANIPIDYYRNTTFKETGYGYFLHKDVLLLCDYDSDTLFFDKEKNEWFVYDEHDCLLLEKEIDEQIKIVNEFLGEERCKRAALVVEKELLDESPEKHYERVEFLSITCGDKISALKDFCSVNE